MSTIYVAGPAYIWVGVDINPNSQNPARPYAFFGFTERGLTISRSGLYEDVNVDYAGNSPADVSMLGQEARITGDFTRYNENVAELCASFFLGTAANGIGPNFSIGTLLTLENSSYPMIIYCPYAEKVTAHGNVPPVLQNQTRLANMIAIYAFPSVYMADQYEVTMSVKRKAPRVTWKAIPVFGTFDSNGVFQAGSAPYNAYAIYSEYTYANIPNDFGLDKLLAIID